MPAQTEKQEEQLKAGAGVPGEMMRCRLAWGHTGQVGNPRGHVTKMNGGCCGIPKEKGRD